MAITDRQLTEQGKERKQQILDAAEQLFAERGYAPTRIADICETAGVAKGLFYWYFENKESLFAELVRSMRKQLRRVQGAEMAAYDDPIMRIRRATEASVRFMGEHRAYFSLLDVERADGTIDVVLQESSVVYIADAAKLVLEAQQAGAIPDDHDPRLLAFGVLGSVSHFTHFHRAGHLDLPVDDLATFVADWVVRALGGLGAASDCGTPAQPGDCGETAAGAGSAVRSPADSPERDVLVADRQLERVGEGAGLFDLDSRSRLGGRARDETERCDTGGRCRQRHHYFSEPTLIPRNVT